MPLPSYTIRCTHNECIAYEIYETRFIKPEGFTFRPGQYIMMDFPLIDNANDIQPRAYSIASTPEEQDFLFVFKLVEGGRASRWVEGKLQVGDEMRIQGPLGVFTLDRETDKNYLFICTSTGNAPFLSMIKSVLAGGDTRNMALVFGNRHEEDLFWIDAFEELAKEYPNFKLHVVLSKPGEGWKGRKGHVQDIIPDVVQDFSKTNVYICGNPAMVKEVKKLCLEKWGMEKKDVHGEEYI